MKAKFIKFLVGMVFLLGVCIHAYGVSVVNDWGGFYTAYTSVSDDIELTNSYTFSNVLNNPFYDGITINGGGYIIDGNDLVSAFSLNGTKINFMDIKFERFHDTNSALKANNSIVTFTGNIYFTSNLVSGIWGNNGGAIYSEGQSSLIFNNTTVNFSSNQAGIYEGGFGGAIYAEGQSSLAFNDSIVNFTSNTAGSNGGAIMIRDVELSFISSTVNFISNEALGGYISGGGAIYANQSTLTFNNVLVNFTSNTAVTDGGAIKIIDSILNFIGSTVNFIANEALDYNGGTIYVGRSTINFINSEVHFIDNKSMNADEGGGAIWMSGSSFINIENSTISFIGNQSKASGGAVLNYSDDNSEINIRDSSMSFIKNIAGNNGGAIDTKDRLSILNTIVDFIENTGQNGGAIHANTWNAEMNFIDSRIDFANNQAGVYDAWGMRQGGEGGAIMVSGYTLNIENSTISFISNQALANGGAISNDKNIHIKESSVSFIGNTGQNGGAIHANSSYAEMNFIDSRIDFANNQAGVYDATWDMWQGGDGGAIRVSGYILNIENSTISFIGNQAMANGGAILNDNSNIHIKESSVSFIGNTGQNGGAIHANTWNAEMNFIGSRIDFANNQAVGIYDAWGMRQGGEGGAIRVSGYTLNIENSTISFISNQALANGGAISNDKNIHIKESSVSFIGNTGQNGGAIHANSSYAEMNFIDSRIDFANNQAGIYDATWQVWQGGEGGAIRVSGYTLNIENSTISFIGNSGKNGGAIHADSWNAEMNFIDSRIDFANNQAGIYDETWQVWQGGEGGAIMVSGYILNIENSTISFIGNQAMANGGAISNDKNIHIKESSVSFIGNTGQKGGAIYANNWDGSEINFINSKIDFANNQALMLDTGWGLQGGEGGAIGVYGNVLNIKNSTISFIGNHAESKGGAIYAGYGSSITFIAGADILFRDNTADTKPNDIYMDDSRLYLFANEHQIRMEGGILAYNESEIIYNNVSGGSWYLSGINVFDNMGKFEIGANSVVTVQDSSWTYMNNTQVLSLDNSEITFAAKTKDTYIYFFENSGGGVVLQDSNLIFDASENRKIELNSIIITGTGNIEKIGVGTLELKGNINFSPDFKISQGVVKATAAVFGKAVIDTNGKYSMLNGVRIDSMTVTKDLIINGTLAIDVSFGVDFFDSWSDIVIAMNTVTIAQGKLELNVLQETEVIGSSVVIIYADGLGSGEFLESQFGKKIYTFEWVSQSGTIGANSYNNIGYLVFDGLIPPPPFDEIAQGHNEKEIAQLIVNDSRLKNLHIAISGLSNDNQKQMVLKQLSGVFLINTITAAARPIGIENLYEHIRTNNASESRFWVEVYGQGHTINEGENSIGDFKEEGFGTRLGFDIYENSKDMLGFYVRYGKNDLKQAKDSATMTDAELGMYGGIFKYKKIRLKGNLGFGIVQFDVKRVIDVGAGFTPALNAKSEVNTQSIKIGGQVEYIIETKTVREIEVKPFIGFQGGYVHSGEILEEGAGEANLKVAEHNYLQAEALLGIGIGNKNINMSDRAKSVITWFIPTLLWNAKVYGGYLITDETPEYEISFRASEDKKMKIWGTDKGKIRAGLALSGEYLITEQVSVYSNLDASFGEKSLGYYANVGIGYRFAKGQAKVKAKPAQKPAPEPILAPAPIEEPKLELEPVTVPQVELEPMPIEVKQEEAQARRQNPQIESFKLEVAKFDTDKFELKQESKDPIKEVVNKIKAQGYKKITVEGHTDITGNQEYNIILSERRAKAVADEFIKNGIDPNKIEAVGFGPKIPTADNETLEGRIKNRRVEIFVE